ncbi:MAG TPA: penicillin-binding protein 2 [Candidatus Saccharimonadales bacterium]|nr:penicillin-binding protein 2 [Candidatus Saccharimonadales bacterium]
MQEPAPTFRRIRLITIFMCVVGAIFIVRLFYIQVVKNDYYEAEALKEHTAKFAVPASRGEIYARDGPDKIVPLVLNEPTYTVFADPRGVKDATKVADVMRRIAGGNVVAHFEEGLKNKERQYTVLARQINKQQADLIKKENLAGVGLQAAEKRVYLEGSLAAQVLGFVNGEGKGQYGIEQALNDELAGKPGQLKAVTDVNGVPISIGQQSVQTPAENGKSLVLSIDRTVQSYTEAALKAGLERVKATRGSVIVMNPNNGHILAMANAPTFEPAKYDTVTDYVVFQNRVVNDAYEPGSVIKPFTMAVGLNEGVIQPDTTYTNTGSTQVADATIKNVSNDVTGRTTMTQVLRFSLNTGVVHVLRLLGGSDDVNAKAKETLYKYFGERFFFGEPTGVPLGEAAGDLIAPDDPQGGPVRYANMTFGQGLTMTMIQAASTFSAMVNGGTYYSPQLISGYRAADGTVAPKQPSIRKSDVLSAQTSEKLRQMIHDTRADSNVSRNDKKGYFIGGKSGTAQVYDPATGKYSETNTIGSYIGFGGQQKAEYVIMVRVDDARIGEFAGSAAAAPIFGDISSWLLDYLKIQPKA